MSKFFKLGNSPCIMAWDGLRGVKVIPSEMVIDECPYIEFIYDGDNTIQVGFDSDAEMHEYLSCMERDGFEPYIFDPKDVIVKNEPSLGVEVFDG